MDFFEFSRRASLHPSLSSWNSNTHFSPSFFYPFCILLVTSFVTFLMPDVSCRTPCSWNRSRFFDTKTEYSRQKIDLGLKVMLEIEKIGWSPEWPWCFQTRLGNLWIIVTGFRSVFRMQAGKYRFWGNGSQPSHKNRKGVNLKIDLPPEHVPHLELEFCHFYVFQCSHASGVGGRYFNELCGLNVLYSSRQSSINTWASFKV